MRWGEVRKGEEGLWWIGLHGLLLFAAESLHRRMSFGDMRYDGTADILQVAASLMCGARDCRYVVPHDLSLKIIAAALGT